MDAAHQRHEPRPFRVNNRRGLYPAGLPWKRGSGHLHKDRTLKTACHMFTELRWMDMQGRVSCCYATCCRQAIPPCVHGADVLPCSPGYMAAVSARPGPPRFVSHPARRLHTASFALDTTAISHALLLRKHRRSQALNLPPFLRAPSRRLEQSLPRRVVLEPHRLFRRAHPHAALLVHGDGLPGLQPRALGYEYGRQPRVACLKREVEKGLVSVSKSSHNRT